MEWYFVDVVYLENVTIINIVFLSSLLMICGFVCPQMFSVPKNIRVFNTYDI